MSYYDFKKDLSSYEQKKCLGLALTKQASPTITKKLRVMRKVICYVCGILQQYGPSEDN